MNRLNGVKKSIFYISFPLSFIGFILPIYALDMGASPFEVGLLYSIFSLCSILIRPIVGRWIDKKGRRNGFIVGIVSYVLVSGLFLVGNNYEYILAARIFQSIASSFLWISVDAMVSDVSKVSERSRNFGIIEQCANKGEVIGASLGFTVIFSSKFNNPFTLVFSIFLIVSLLALFTAIKSGQETLQISNVKKIEDKVQLNKKFKEYLFVIAILSVIETMVAPIFLIYLKEFITKDLGLISLLFIPSAILSTILPPKMGSLSDKYGKNNMLILGILIAAVFTVTIPIFNRYYIFMIVYTMICVGGMISYPAEAALVSEMCDESQRGAAYGMYKFAIGIGGIIGPLIGVFIYQYLSKDIVFYIQGAALIIICVLIDIVLKNPS